MGSAFGKEERLYPVDPPAGRTGICPQICLSDSGFGAEFKSWENRLARGNADGTGFDWRAPSIYGKVLNNYDRVLHS